MEKKDFLDEKIIRMLDQVDKPTEKIVVPETEQTEADLSNSEPSPEYTIYTGLKIKGQWFDFKERIFLDGKVAMTVPIEFTPMDIATAKIKYPSEQRPQTILTDDTGAINIMFSYMEDPMKNEEAEEVRDTLIGIMCRVNPGIKPRENGMEVISEKNIAYVEYSNPVMDGKLYNLMYFVEVHGNLLMGCFNCVTRNAKYWKPIFMEMMRSIQILSSLESEE